MLNVLLIVFMAAILPAPRSIASTNLFAEIDADAAIALDYGENDAGCDRNGIGPLLWVLHDGRKPGRLSLVWDAIEPLRLGLVRAVIGYAAGRVFHKDDFAVFEGGVVRLKGQIIREIATLALATAPIRECVKVVRWLEGQL